jgi:hypothetical protein
MNSRLTIFWDISQSSACRVRLASYLLGLLFNLKMETVCTFETSLNFYRTTQRYTPEASILDKNNVSRFGIFFQMTQK